MVQTSFHKDFIMKIAVMGAGYVGLVTGACFAEMGNTVVCLDSDESKVASLRSGGVPIFEPGLSRLIGHNSSAGRLSFTADAAEAVGHADIVFIWWARRWRMTGR